MADGEELGAPVRSSRLRSLEHRALHGALLVAALLVATLATAAIGGDDEERLATADRGDRPTTTTAPVTPTTGPPVTVPVEGAEQGPAPVAPSGSRPGGAGGAGAGGTGVEIPTTTTTEPPPPPPPPPVVSGGTAPAEVCGGRLPKHGGGEWVCTFSDEFEGTELDRSKWMVFETAATGWHSGQECMVDRPANVAVGDGVLRLTARREAHGFYCEHPTPGKGYGSQWTSGMVSTWGKFAQQYGRVEIRAQFPDVTVPGIHSALWMWPDNPTAHLTWTLVTGEIDIAEFYSRHPDRVIPYLHHVSLDGKNTNNYCLLPAAGQFHTYAIEWTPAVITISYDGATCLQTHSTTAFHEPYFLNLTQALGIGRQNRFTEATPLPATMAVDYVRVWR